MEGDSRVTRTLVSASIALAILLLGSFQSQAGAWVITKPEWTEEDEKGYSDFIQKIGESMCESPDDCINSDVNPFWQSDRGGRGIKFNADCADLVYMFRAYYAWKNGLPFTYVSGVYSRGGGDIRFSLNGNKVGGRQNIYTGANGRSVLATIKGAVNSGTYRVGPDVDDKPLTDLYPVKIQRGSIRPGTAIYDVNGHVALVYKVGDDGRVFYMDSHPDFTLTRSVYGPQFGRDNPALGAGFKNFRPIKLVGYSTRSDGALVGGRYTIAGNEQIADYSTEQYTGNAPSESKQWRLAKFQHNGVEAGYYEFVRASLAIGKLSYNPVLELKETIKTLCHDLYDRSRFVEIAIENGIDKKQQPSNLPDNIYGTSNHEWEVYSTPSRDARLKTAFKALKDSTEDLIRLWLIRDNRIVFEGTDLKSELLAAYNKYANECTVSYMNSAGRRVTLTFDEVRQRLFQLSFDPYHCIERRWGATSPEELASCPDNATKRRWFEAQQRLRNQIDRRYEQMMSFDVRDLERGAEGSGVDTPPDVDVKKVIELMGHRTPFQGMQPPGY